MRSEKNLPADQNLPEEEGTEDIPKEDEQSMRKKEGAKQLEKQLKEKSIGERWISEYQTSEQEIPGTDIKRGHIFRFERGQIYKAYITIRREMSALGKEIRKMEARGKDTTKENELLEEKRGLLNDIRERADTMTENLDDLNKQYCEKSRQVEIDTEFGQFTVPVIVLDLEKDTNPEDDKRTPYFFLGGIGTNYHQTAALSMAMALDGHKVYVPMQPEQPSVKKPDNFNQLLSKEKTLRIHAEIAKATMKALGIDNVDLIGYSTGASTALEVATDSEFASTTEINNLIALEPLGIKQMDIKELARRFGFVEGGRALLNPRSRLTAISQGIKEGQGEPLANWQTAKILANKQFDEENLGDMLLNVKNRVIICMGDKSPLMDTRLAEEVFTRVELQRQTEHPGAPPVEFIKVKTDDHTWPLIFSLGLMEKLRKGKQEENFTTIKTSDLKDSAMHRILADIKE